MEDAVRNSFRIAKNLLTTLLTQGCQAQPWAEISERLRRWIKPSSTNGQGYRHQVTSVFYELNFNYSELRSKTAAIIRRRHSSEAFEYLREVGLVCEPSGKGDLCQ